MTLTTPSETAYRREGITPAAQKKDVFLPRGALGQGVCTVLGDMRWTPAPVYLEPIFEGRTFTSLSRGCTTAPGITTAYTESHWISQQFPVAEVEARASSPYVPASATPEAQLLDRAAIKFFEKPAHHQAHEGPTTGCVDGQSETSAASLAPLHKRGRGDQARAAPCGQAGCICHLSGGDALC